MSDVDDPYNLQRFVAAQEGSYPQVCRELGAGHKRGHWIWFVFPQLRGLGRSPTAERFGITSLDEARAYLAQPILGPRLRECARLLTAIGDRPIAAVVGYPDDLKIRSSMTLFAAAADDDPVFPAVLDKFYDGQPDALTLTLLSGESGSASRAAEPRSG